MRRRPNIVFVMADDHAAHAISAYGSRVNETPQLDRLAAEGMRFDSCFCTNSICAPSRAAILTGTYSHVNGVTTLSAPFDSAQPTFPATLQAAGYQTAIFGKWHLGHGAGHDPVGFDEWRSSPSTGSQAGTRRSPSACWCTTKHRTEAGSPPRDTRACMPVGSSESRPPS